MVYVNEDAWIALEVGYVKCAEQQVDHDDKNRFCKIATSDIKKWAPFNPRPVIWPRVNYLERGARRLASKFDVKGARKIFRWIESRGQSISKKGPEWQAHKQATARSIRTKIDKIR